MSNLNEANQNVVSLARVFQSVIDLSNAVTAAGGIDQIIGEANVRRSDAEAAATRAEATRDALRKEVRDAEQELVNVRRDVQTAKREAENIVAVAETAATNIVNNAHTTGAGIVDSAQARANEIDAKVATATTECERLQTQAEELEARYNRARAKAAELLGG